MSELVKQILELIGDHDLSGLDQLNIVHRIVVTLDFPDIDQASIGHIEDKLRSLINKSS